MVKGQVIILLRIIWNVAPELVLRRASCAQVSNRFRSHNKEYTENIWLRQ